MGFRCAFHAPRMQLHRAVMASDITSSLRLSSPLRQQGTSLVRTLCLLVSFFLDSCSFCLVLVFFLDLPRTALHAQCASILQLDPIIFQRLH